MKKRLMFALFVICIFFSLIFFIVTTFVKAERYHREFAYSKEVIANPLMGYAPVATGDSVTEDINLVYVDVTWKELEDQEGVFDWEKIEQENQFSKWREEGKHIVFRFILDYPTDEQHQDIPEWLTSKMSDAGDTYATSYGKGFSPNYSDKTLLSYYKKAVAAMGERWGNDDLISYIELGVLGHWGEWHINTDEGNIRDLPKESVREKYVTPWTAAFPKANILMRRSFATAKKHDLGLYNDMAGHAESTDTWLEWIESGGSYDQTGEKNAIVAMPNAWKDQPIGGEFTSADSMQTLLEKNLKQTTNYIKESHTTFLGPKIAEDVNDDKKGYNTVLKNMGYRLWISEADLDVDSEDKTKLTMTWKNSGIAPIYRDWKVYVYVKNWTGMKVEKVEVPIKLSDILPDGSKKVSVDLSTPEVSEALMNQYSISIGIVDPMTKKDAVHFAVDGQEKSTQLVLFE